MQNSYVLSDSPIGSCYAQGPVLPNMRPRVEWMNQTDDRILDALEESGMELTPAVLARNLEYSRSWVSERMSDLLTAGLIENPEGSYYKITDKGRAYLAGDLDADDLQIDNE